MQTKQAIDRLDYFQNAIRAALADATREVERRNTTRQEDLATRRWQMVRLLREYQIFKHTEIFDPAINRSDQHQTAAAKKLKANCVVAGEAFQAFVARWGSEAVLGKWDDYKIALTTLSEGLAAHLRTERTGVTLLLEGSSRTRRLSSSFSKKALMK